MLEKFTIVEKYPNFDISDSKVFSPTGTSRALLTSSLRLLRPHERLLDLGCGSGILGMELNFRFKQLKIFMSDVSFPSTQIAEQNNVICKLASDIRTGSLFQPWEGEKFDFIISDVSGVIPEVGTYFGWFKDIPNESGEDGTHLAIEVIKSAKDFLLNDSSVFVMPVISLSNEEKQLTELSNQFGTLKNIGSYKFPVAKVGSDGHEFLKKMKNVRIETLAGQVLFTTNVYAASIGHENERINNA